MWHRILDQTHNLIQVFFYQHLDHNLANYTASYLVLVQLCLRQHLTTGLFCYMKKKALFNTSQSIVAI